MARLLRKTTPLSAWYDTAITPLYAAIGAGCALCVYTCSRNLMSYPDIVWYKRKPADQVIFNEGNTAATYNEQRLFLASGLNRSTRLLGGGTFSGGNQVYAHKHGDHSAEMA